MFNEPDLSNRSVFERYIDTYCLDLGILLEAIQKLPTPHVTGAFIIQGMSGYEKGVGVMQYFHKWCEKSWFAKWTVWQDSPPMLADMFDWLREDAKGLGSFMAAQIVADLKYLPFMVNVLDWWTWAASGPGSKRGLNVVFGRPIYQPWGEQEWLEHIQQLREAENKELVPLGLGPFHAQDTQNHCCEFSKYTKVMTGIGRPRQVYRHV